MKINLNKKQWETIGKTAGWIKKANDENLDMEFSSGERSVADEQRILDEEEAPSLKQEMMDFLRQSYGTEEDFEYDAEIAIYWFANDYHGGQASELYSILSTSSFRPGPISTLDSEGELVKMMYEDLETKFGRRV